MVKKSGLGRGLDSLIPKKKKTPSEYSTPPIISSEEGKEDDQQKGVIHLEIDKILPNPYQPRVDFSHQELEDLILSIKEHGILQPLVVTKNDDGYELIAGERRLRAAKMAELQKVPVIIREADKQQKLELALIENIQRHNLNALEEAEAFKRLMDEFNLTQEEVAKKVGKSRPVVANALRLLSLPEEVKQAIRNRKITASHARSIAGLSGQKEQLKMLADILSKGLSVHQTEKGNSVIIKKHIRKVDPNLKSKEEELQHALGTKVSIKKKKEGGEVVIEYYSAEDLNNLINKII